MLEYPIHGDVALIKAHEADSLGNLVYRKTARNFGPVMATAAKLTVAQVLSVSEPGSLDPEAVVTPGIFVDRVVACQSPARARGGRGSGMSRALRMTAGPCWHRAAGGAPTSRRGRT